MSPLNEYADLNPTFPLKLKLGMTPEITSGSRITISGGGFYLSSIWARENITSIYPKSNNSNGDD